MSFTTQNKRITVLQISLRNLTVWYMFLWESCEMFHQGLALMGGQLDHPKNCNRYSSARWRSTSTMPEGNAKEDTWKCEVRICYDYLIATANCNYIGTQPADTLPDTWSSHSIYPHFFKRCTPSLHHHVLEVQSGWARACTHVWDM